MRRFAPLLLAPLVPLLSVRPALAAEDEPPPYVRPEPPKELRPVPTRWYGWQIIGADAVGLGLTFLPGDSNAASLGKVLGWTTLLVGAPTIHMTHDLPKKAALSLLRVPAALSGLLVGSLAGVVFCPSNGHDCQGWMRQIGSLGGIGAVAWIDYLTAYAPVVDRR